MTDGRGAVLSEALLELRKLRRQAERALAQTTDENFFRCLDPESNSVALIVKHISGNMRSRWTNFLETDGEKPDRHRDIEFERAGDDTRARLMAGWEDGWRRLFAALEPLANEDLARVVRIRGEEHTVLQAINRQMTHYAAHIGQIVFLAKHVAGPAWKSLSIPRGQSASFDVSRSGEPYRLVPTDATTTTSAPAADLDPSNWDELGALGRRMVDEMMTFLRTVRDRKVWQPMPEKIRRELHRAAPRGSREVGAVYEDFRRIVLPYVMGNVHPRFWGWVIGPGTPDGVLAEMLAAAVNPNVGGGDHAACHVEAAVIGWWKEIFGFPDDASGLLVSGGSMANIIGLAAARNLRAGFDLRKEGVGRSPKPLLIYGSREMHSSIDKAAELLGLGLDAIRKIPVNADFEIDVAALAKQIAADRAAGFAPIAVVGNAGTVSTGAMDDLGPLADLCAKEKIWFHVDGAFGALAVLAPRAHPHLAGIARADSLAFDMHKWMNMPFDIGCVLVRDGEAHRRAFSLTPDYLTHSDRGLAAGNTWFSDFGPELSRGFRALKAWMSMQVHGLEKYGRVIAGNIEQAAHLAARIDREPELERTAPAPLNIVCFRFRAAGWGEEKLNALNQELLLRLQESGIAIVSNATLDGRYSLRVANVNHRSRNEDFDMLVDSVLKIGRELAAGR